MLNTKSGNIHFHENIIVMEAHKNVSISITTGLKLLLKVVKLVGTKPMVYISNRKNCYDLNPCDYKYLDMIPNLRAIAIVCYSEKGYKEANYEAAFIQKPFNIFDNLVEAQQWGRAILDKQISG